MKIRPASAFTLFCVEVQMLHYGSLNSWLLSLYKYLYHRLPDMMMSMCLLGLTHALLKCKLVALSVCQS